MLQTQCKILVFSSFALRVSCQHNLHSNTWLFTKYKVWPLHNHNHQTKQNKTKKLTWLYYYEFIHRLHSGFTSFSIMYFIGKDSGQHFKLHLGVLSLNLFGLKSFQSLFLIFMTLILLETKGYFVECSSVWVFLMWPHD